MAKPKRRNVADFLEEEIFPVLQSFLDRIALPNEGLTIRKFGLARERETGADAQIGEGIQGIRPFYMQFKRPYSWSGDASDVVIISDRMQLGLEVHPQTLFFDLHRKAKTHSDLQHNMLLKLRTQVLADGFGDAAYVCPLFMEFSKYRTHMLAAARSFVFVDDEPWFFRKVSITNALTKVIDFDSVPAFSRHVTIPPLEAVTTHEHSYSFRPDGQQICFHSPKELESESLLLSDWLNSLYDQTYASKWINSENSKEHLDKLVAALRLSDDEKPNALAESSATWVAQWLRFGGFLSRTYGIQQLAFVNRAIPSHHSAEK